MNFDWTILHWIQNTLVCPAMDFLMPKITLLGNGGAVWILSAAGLLATKKYRKYGAFLLAGLTIGVLTGNLTLKPLITRPRPCWLDSSVQLLIANPTDYSFPSGHTLSSVIGAAVLTKANRRFGLAAIPPAALIAFSRLYLYVHFPTDTLAAAVLGAAIGLLTCMIGDRVWTVLPLCAPHKHQGGTEEMKKKLVMLVSLILAVLMLASRAAPAASGTNAADNADPGEWKWERKVTLVCPWGVGGGADGTLRPLQPVLQDILGVAVEIVNVEGAGGANGIDFTCKQPADGYTYVLGTQSHIMLDIQKILPEDFKAELQPVAKLVHSINLIASSKKAMDGKYTNFTEFIAYAKEHPQELTCGMLTATGADAVSLKQTLAGGLGCDITEVEQYIKIVNYGGGAELSSAMVGGHVNICITGADEIRGLIESGDIVPLVSMSENRMSTLPDTECTGELGIDSYVGTWRGIFCRTGTPQAAVDAMSAALEEAWNSDTYQEFLKNACYLDRPGYADAASFQTLIDEEYVTFEDYLKGAGLI